MAKNWKWIPGDRGDFYTVDYVIGDDPTMQYDKFKLGKVESIEGSLNQLLATKHGCELGQVLIQMITRCQS